MYVCTVNLLPKLRTIALCGLPSQSIHDIEHSKIPKQHNAKPLHSS